MGYWANKRKITRINIYPLMELKQQPQIKDILIKLQEICSIDKYIYGIINNKYLFILKKKQ
jgi:hypothetical protein